LRDDFWVAQRFSAAIIGTLWSAFKGGLSNPQAQEQQALGRKPYGQHNRGRAAL